MEPRHAVIARALLLVGLVAAVAYAGRVVAGSHGTVDDRIALLFATKLVLSFGVATWFVWTADRPPPRWWVRLADWVERHSAEALAVLIVGSAAIVFAATPQIGFGTGDRGVGYGHDGLQYGWMAEQFSWFDKGAVGQFAYRFLPSMLVHYSGLGTFTGFRVLNVVCHVLTTLLAYRIAMRFTASRATGVLAAAFVVARKFGFKFTIYYPVITDGLGDLLLMAIVWTTLERRTVLYLLAMVAAVATRENLLALLPFHVLYAFRTGARGRPLVITTALQAIPAAAFVLSRRYPVFVAIGDIGPAWLVTAARAFVRSPALQQRWLLGYVNALGVLAIVPVLAWRRSATFLAAHYEWAWFSGVTLVLTAICGSDFDRYATWMTPLPVALLASELREVPSPPRLWLGLLVLHLVAMELFLPWHPEQAFYISRTAAHAAGAAYRYLVVYAWALFAIVVAMRLSDRSSGPSASRAA